MTLSSAIILTVCLVGCTCAVKWTKYIKIPAFDDRMCPADHVGFQTDARSKASCAVRCNGTPGCRGVVYLHDNGTCYLITADNAFDTSTPLPGAVFFKAILDCPNVTAVTHGWIEGGEVGVGSSVTAGCDPGYILNGPEQRTCEPAGTWSDGIPECLEEWTVFQTRFDGSVDFNRNWTDYVNGFGSPPGGEFWLGLEAIHNLTAGRSCELMVVLEVAGANDTRNETRYASYSSFSVDSAAADYTLHVAGFSGIGLEDGLAYHSGCRFSTYDNDNDNNTIPDYGGGNCASVYSAGWWYNDCAALSVLNGYPFYWSGVSGISKSVMKFRCM